MVACTYYYRYVQVKQGRWQLLLDLWSRCEICRGMAAWQAREEKSILRQHIETMVDLKRIRTPKQIVRSLSKKRLGKNTSSVEEEIGLGGLELEDQGRQTSSVVLRPAEDDESVEASDGDLDDQPQSSVLIIKELDLSQQEQQQDQPGMKEKEEDLNHHRQKVAELNNGLEEVKNELEEFKRTSSMERDALRKELYVMKGIDSQPHSEGGNPVDKAEWTQKDSEKGGVTGMFASFAGLFDDEGFIKCCLPSGSGRN